MLEIFELNIVHAMCLMWNFSEADSESKNGNP